MAISSVHSVSKFINSGCSTRACSFEKGCGTGGISIRMGSWITTFPAGGCATQSAHDILDAVHAGTMNGHPGMDIRALKELGSDCKRLHTRKAGQQMSRPVQDLVKTRPVVSCNSHQHVTSTLLGLCPAMSCMQHMSCRTPPKAWPLATGIGV